MKPAANHATRVKDFLKYNKVSEADLIRKSGITVDEFNAFMNHIDYVVVLKLIDAFPINPNWLIDGEGEMLTRPIRKNGINIGAMNDRVRELRISKNMTQEDMAAVLGKARSTYAQLEIGRQSPTLSDLKALKAHFGVSYEWIIDGSVSKTMNTSATEKLEELNQEIANLKEALFTSMSRNKD